MVYENVWKHYTQQRTCSACGSSKSRMLWLVLAVVLPPRNDLVSMVCQSILDCLWVASLSLKFCTCSQELPCSDIQVALGYAAPSRPDACKPKINRLMATVAFGQYLTIFSDCLELLTSWHLLAKNLSGSWISWWPNRLCAAQARWRIAFINILIDGFCCWILLLDIEMHWDVLSINIGHVICYFETTMMCFQWCVCLYLHDFSRRHQDSFVGLRGIPLHGTSSSRESTRGTKKIGRSPVHIFFSHWCTVIRDSSTLMLIFWSYSYRWNRWFARGARDISIVPVTNWRHILSRHSSQCCIRWHGFSNFGCGWSPRLRISPICDLWSWIICCICCICGFQGVLNVLDSTAPRWPPGGSNVLALLCEQWPKWHRCLRKLWPVDLVLSSKCVLILYCCHCSRPWSMFNIQQF